MTKVGGNTTALIDVKVTSKNAIGEKVSTWSQKASLRGWLDRVSTVTSTDSYDSKHESSEWLFICDYADLSGVDVANSRVRCAGEVYYVQSIYDPMGLHHSLEIRLKR